MEALGEVGIVCKPLQPQFAAWKIKLLSIPPYVSIPDPCQWYSEQSSIYIHIWFSFWQLNIRDPELKPTAACKDKKPF